MPQTAKLKRNGFTLSDLPPLGEGGRAWREGEKRRVNRRWLYGTILTGVVGTFLMGMAIWGSLEKGVSDRSHVRLIPLSDIKQKETRFVERFSNAGRKADKLSPITTAFVATKQTIKLSTVAKVGDREVTRVKSYAKVGSALITASTDRAGDVPAFNPIKLMSNDNSPLEASDDTSGDISVSMRDLTLEQIDKATFIVPSPRDVLEKVRETSLTLANPAKILAIGGLNPFGFGNKSEMSSTVDKTPITKLPASRMAERTLNAKDGDTVVSLLLEGGSGRDEARLIAATFNKSGQDLTLKPGNRIRLSFTENKAGNPQPARIALNVGEREQTVALSDDGRYLMLDTSKQAIVARAKAATVEDEEEESGNGIRLYNAIYETALKQEIPKKIIEELVRIYAYDIDFNKGVTEGDSFEVFYGTEEEGERGDVLYASLFVDGETRKYYKFQTLDDNALDYYDEKGKSAKKFLIRKPMSDGIFRSGFGMRRHPIYRYARMHTGVDWSTRVGTPVVASGNGVIELAERQSGYGNRVEITHANGYMTTYNHLSRFAKGIKEGVRVTQGQIIAYSGNTGASTGPHLHYEVSVNGNYVDPLRVRLPQGRELNGGMLAEFNKERLRIEALVNKKDTLRQAAIN